MKQEQLAELVLQSLEHARGRVSVYKTAIRCAAASELRDEWTRYLEESEKHVEALANACAALQLDSAETSPRRELLQGLSLSLVEAMTKAMMRLSKEEAQLVACECVILAETKGHLDWELLGKAAKELPGAAASSLREAHAGIAEQEDEHLYRTQGWWRELWIGALDLAAVVPPPEGRKQARSAMPAAQAQSQPGQASA